MLTVKAKTRKAGKMVSTTYTDQIIREYKQERWVNNSKHIGKEDSLSVWYSAEELEQFLEKLRMHGADGIRFYFAAYPPDHAEQPEYAGRQTMVMVATQSKETVKGIVDKDLYITTETGTSVLAYNNGKLCPPYCRPKSGDLDDWEIGISIVDKGSEGIAVV